MATARYFVDQQTPSAVAAEGALRRVWQAGSGRPPTSLPLAFPSLPIMSSPLHPVPGAAGRDPRSARPAVPADQAHLRATLTRCFQTNPDVQRFIDGQRARPSPTAALGSNWNQSGH